MNRQLFPRVADASYLLALSNNKDSINKRIKAWYQTSCLDMHQSAK